jgi:hypothetical protein
MTSPSTRLALVPAAAIALVVAGTFTAGCMMCKDIACSGGFEWEATPADGVAVAPGAYHVAIELDDVLYEFDCTITERARESECIGPADENADEFEVAIDLQSRQTSEEWDPDAPVGSISVDALALEGDDERTTRGPRDVLIVLDRDGTELVEVGYDIEYERDEDFYGDERCGFCDLLEAREVVWSEG